MENKNFTIPIAVVSPTDVARLIRETENLDEFFRQSEIRQGGDPQSAPRYSRLLDEIVVTNGMNLLQNEDRLKLIDHLNGLQQSAPVLHMSFSVDPPGPYVQKIVSWLRDNIDKEILVRVGLQPNIGAGCVVRTTNRSFDFSLRRFFDNKHEFFMEKLHQSMQEEATEELVDNKEVEQLKAEQTNPEQPSETPPTTELEVSPTTTTTAIPVVSEESQLLQEDVNGDKAQQTRTMPDDMPHILSEQSQEGDQVQE